MFSTSITATSNYSFAKSLQEQRERRLKEDERETEHAELPKWPNNEDTESETGPGEQLKRWNRQACLQRRRDRLAAESTEQRLQQLRTNQHQRLAAESAEEREPTLQQLRTNQHERQAA